MLKKNKFKPYNNIYLHNTSVKYIVLSIKKCTVCANIICIFI